MKSRCFCFEAWVCVLNQVVWAFFMGFGFEFALRRES